MKDDKLSDLSMDFAVAIYKLCKQLKCDNEYIISNQILRSATSIGANIREAKYASSKADFINKFHIALKEANETSYWLELMSKTDLIKEDVYVRLEEQCRTIRIMLIHSLRTAKG